MAQNAIINTPTTGAPAWDELGPGIPSRTKSMAIKARGNVDVLVRFPGNPAGNYWTIPAGSTLSMMGDFWQGELYVQAAAGTVVEVMACTVMAVIGQ